MLPKPEVKLSPVYLEFLPLRYFLTAELKKFIKTNDFLGYYYALIIINNSLVKYGVLLTDPCKSCKGVCVILWFFIGLTGRGILTALLVSFCLC